MITLQMMKGTGPYNQMQRYIADVHKDLTPQQRAGKFTALLKKYVNNQNKHRPGQNVVPKSLLASFTWVNSPEGGMFWKDVSKYKLDNAPEVKPQPAVVEQPKPAAPALVWPKGFYICVQIQHEPFVRFINEEGQCVNGRFSKWAAPQNFHRWQQKWPTYKRPETPLPNGLQWEEGYTHANRYKGTWFQFNDEYYAWDGEVKPWGKFGRKREWFEKRTTIQRYPDNQPLILDVPPQAPVRPVEARMPEPVGQPVPEPIVEAKAPVEAPKAPPVPKKQEQVVKKPVGWWK